MVWKPLGSRYGLVKSPMYCCGLAKPTASAMPCDSTWFLIVTFQRSAPSEKPATSQRPPTVHCFDVSGLRPASPESPLGPASRSYCALPGMQPTEPGNGQAYELDVEPLKANAPAISDIAGARKPVP